MSNYPKRLIEVGLTIARVSAHAWRANGSQRGYARPREP